MADTPSNGPCVHCQDEQFPWECVIALGQYEGELSRAVLQTKSPKGEAVALALGRLLYENRRQAFESLNADAILPVPMHWSRRLRRGTNGPDLISEALSQRLRIPLRSRWLKRRRLTPLQTELTPTERHRNQRKSFRATRPSRIAGQRILLVDDVLTTGSTAADATGVLLAAGAVSVSIAVIARGIGADSH